MAQTPTSGPIDMEGEGVWIDVIRKMDETYADLVAQQVELERKNAELEEAQAFIAGVMAAMTDVLLVCDMEGRLVEVNGAAERALGRTGASLAGAPLADIVDAASRPALDGPAGCGAAARARLRSRSGDARGGGGFPRLGQFLPSATRPGAGRSAGAGRPAPRRIAPGLPRSRQRPRALEGNPAAIGPFERKWLRWAGWWRASRMN